MEKLVKWCNEQSPGPEVSGYDHAADTMEFMSVGKNCHLSVYTSSCMTRGLALMISFLFLKECMFLLILQRQEGRRER